MKLKTNNPTNEEIVEWLEANYSLFLSKTIPKYVDGKHNNPVSYWIDTTLRELQKEGYVITKSPICACKR